MNLIETVKEIRDSDLSPKQVEMAIIRSYALEYYEYRDLDDILQDLQTQEGIVTSITNFQKLAWSMGVKRIPKSYRICNDAVLNKDVFTFPNGAKGYSEYTIKKDSLYCLVMKVYAKNLDLIVIVKYNRIDSDKKTIETKISPKTILNLPEGHFYCNECNTVHPRSFARQKGDHGGCKCKTCYNKQRSKEHKDPMKKKRSKIYQLTQFMINGRTSSGDPYKGLPKQTVFGKEINRPTQGYKYLGCTSEEFQQYIHGLLPEGWTLEDRGTLWELDHIEPLSNFNLMDDTEMKKAAHHTNVRPLGKTENRGRRASGVANWGKHD